MIFLKIEIWYRIDNYPTMDPRKIILNGCYLERLAANMQRDAVAKYTINMYRSSSFRCDIFTSEISAANVELEITFRAYELAQLKYFMLLICHLINSKYKEFDNIINANIESIVDGSWDYNSIMSALVPICTLVADSNDQKVVDYCAEILTFVGAQQKSSYRDDIIEMMIIAVRHMLKQQNTDLILATVTLMQYVEENNVGELVESNIDEEIEFLIDELIRMIKTNEGTVPHDRDFTETINMLEKFTLSHRFTELDSILGKIADIVILA